MTTENELKDRIRAALKIQAVKKTWAVDWDGWLAKRVSELWCKFKKWRKKKHEKVGNDSDGTDDCTHCGDELRRR